MHISLTAWGLTGASPEAEERTGLYAAGLGDDYALMLRDTMTEDARSHGLGFAAELTRITSDRFEGSL